jgi:outer membrane biosynthesis protein TonB
MLKHLVLVVMFLLATKFSNAQSGTVITQEQPDSLPYVMLGTMPQYPGEQAAITRYIYDALDYPIREMEHIYGTAYISVIVERNGSLSNVEIKKGINLNVNEDLLRIVNGMKGWKPGIKAGKPVRTSTFIRFKFGPR